MHKRVKLECVGIPSSLGGTVARVAGLIRFGKDQQHDPLKFVHGNVLDPKGGSSKIICQLVNDQARYWGGGVAKSASQKYPQAQRLFTEWFLNLPKSKRLGSVHFAEVADLFTIASLVGQEGFGASETPRIRYAALEKCFERSRRLQKKPRRQFICRAWAQVSQAALGKPSRRLFGPRWYLRTYRLRFTTYLQRMLLQLADSLIDRRRQRTSDCHFIRTDLLRKI